MIRTDFIKAVLIGSNKTGKSYTVLTMAKRMLKADRGRKIIIVSSNFHDETLKSVRKIRTLKALKSLNSGIVQYWDFDIQRQHGDFGIFKTMYEAMLDGYLQHGAIFFDDATNYFPNNTVDGTTRSFFSSYRHYYIDLFYIFHNIQDVPPFVYRNIHHIILKKTAEPGLTIKYISENRKIPNANKFYAAYIELQRTSGQPPHRYKTINITTGL